MPHIKKPCAWKATCLNEHGEAAALHFDLWVQARAFIIKIAEKNGNLNVAHRFKQLPPYSVHVGRRYKLEQGECREED